LFAAYWREFVFPFDHSRYNIRVGLIPIPDAATGRERRIGHWQRLKTKGGGASVRFPFEPKDQYRIIEKHLDPDRWNAHCLTNRRARPLDNFRRFGLYAGRKVPHAVLDLDCHGRLGCYLDHRSRRMPVANLALDHVKNLRRLYEIRPLPDVLFTSSPSLGIHAYWKFALPIETGRLIEVLGRAAEEAGVTAEVYPNTSNCLRRPMGVGSYTLAQSGVIRDFAGQMRHYLEPGPIPPFPELVHMLLGLWDEQHRRLRACYALGQVQDHRRLPRIDLQAVEAQRQRRTGEILEWVDSGAMPEAGRRPGELTPSEPTLIEIDGHPQDVASIGGSGRPGAVGPQRFSEEFRALPWLDLLYHLGTVGLPHPNCLNPALLELAKYLLSGECTGDEAGVTRLLGVFCLTRHNGYSQRLNGLGADDELPQTVVRSITEAIALAKTRVEGLGELRARSYERPLRLKHLLTGEGEANLYIPQAGCLFLHEGHPPLHLFLGCPLWGSTSRWKKRGGSCRPSSIPAHSKRGSTRRWRRRSGSSQGGPGRKCSTDAWAITWHFEGAPPHCTTRNCSCSWAAPASSC
jgi:hypothetical protein